MTAEKFYDLLMRTIQASDYSDKDEVLSLLRRASVVFDPLYEFATRSWQHYEDVIIRIAPEYKARLEKHIEQLKDWCFEIYEETDEYDIKTVRILVGEGKAQEQVTQEVFFEELQAQIIEVLKEAKYTIWVAVAWFTDPVLFDLLKKKKAEGINVQVIMDDDDINRQSGLDFEEHFETYRIPSFGKYLTNIVHHKFCVIDLETVVHGSYNWSKKAQYNKETLSVEHSRDIAERFADEFIRLKKDVHT
jgi:phosphatidylserine/phosphatidylglycerophosphate/cardiolipin synthase-like enzyme